MDARRATALVSLGMVGAVVVGLIATSSDRNDGARPVTGADSAEQTVVEPAETVADVVADAAPEPATTEPAPIATEPENEAAVLPDLGPHPEFLEVQEWLQTDATSFDDFDGKVVAVQFWTFGCRNCQATWPHLRDLYAKYGGDDFEIVGVHAPEFDFERDVDAIATAAEEYGLVWPIAVDNEKRNFRSWQDRRFWPRIFLIDRRGDIRFDHIGEGAYDDIDAAVGALIAEGR